MLELCSCALWGLHRLVKICAGSACRRLRCNDRFAHKLLKMFHATSAIAACLWLCSSAQAFVVYGYAGSGCSGDMTPLQASGPTGSNTFVRNANDPSPANRQATCYSTSEAYKSVAVASGRNLAGPSLPDARLTPAVYTFGGALTLKGAAHAADTSCRQERWLQLEYNIPGRPGAGETSYRASTDGTSR